MGEPHDPSPSPSGRRFDPSWILALAVPVLVAGIAALIALGDPAPADPISADAPSTIVAGTPGGEAIAVLTPGPTVEATLEPTAEGTPAPEPTAQSTPDPTPAPTQPPAPAQTPAPVTPPPATPAPTPIVVAVAEPADSVAAFYGHVASGRFDAAYGLWSDRMRATYPRAENLDERFDETRSISFEQLFVASQGATTATVQANFVETYDGGSSRRFIGYWELVLVDGRWLLDAPHY